MYYPSFFANVRPYETVGTLGSVRERLENPLDLSVKQVTRAEGSCGPDHEDIQIIMEHRKLAAAAAAAAGIQSGTFGHQMSMLDQLYGYKHFSNDPQCQMPGNPNGLMGGPHQALSSAFCPNGVSPSVNPQYGLMPGLLQQIRDPLAPPAPPPFSIDPSGIPYHMRINNAAAALAINNANQRVALYSHGTLQPSLASSFGVPHTLSLYSDLFSDMNARRPEPETRFSDHLQRLREQNLQQSKYIMDPLNHAINSNGHNSAPRNSNNKFNCYTPGPIPSHSLLSMTQPQQTTICNKNQCNQNEIKNNSNHNDNNNGEMSINCTSKKLSQPLIVDEMNGSEYQNFFGKNSSPNLSNQKSHQLWSPQNIQSSPIQKSLYQQQQQQQQQQHQNESEKEKKFEAQHNKNNDNSESNQNEMKHFFKENLLNNNQVLSNKRIKVDVECVQKRENFQEIIIDEECFDSSNRNSNVENQLKSQENDMHHNEKSHFGLPNQSKSNISCSGTTTITSSECLNHSVVMVESGKLPQGKTSHENQPGNCDGSYDNNILSGKSIANSSINVPSAQIAINLINTTTSPNNSQQQKTQQSNQTNEIKLSQFKSYFGNVQNQHNHSNTNIKHIPGVVSLENDDQSSAKNQTSQASGAQVKGTTTSTTTPTTSTNITKQLKDYKLLPKNQNMNAIDKNKRQPKEMKTVEVQCDGPDWTPIVLNALLKTKLQKVVRRKMTLNDSEKNNETFSKQLINHKKETKRERKKDKNKCKQQHNDRSRNNSNIRSRSSSVSTVSSRSSPERKQHLSSRKRSMLQSIANSDGYVADQIPKKTIQANLFASDPSQLGREERALQRAIKHFEQHQTHCNSNQSDRKDSAEEYNAVQPIQESNDKICQNDQVEQNDKNNNQCKKTSHKNGKKHQKSISNSIENQNSVKSAKNINKKSNKKVKEHENEMQVQSNRSNLLKPSKKMDAKREKRKLRERMLGNLLEEQKSDEGDGLEEEEGKSKKKRKKSKINEKCDDNNDEKKNQDEDPSETNDITMNEWKQKKVITNVRRRRFRSGLDMIRHPQRRKKSRVNHGHGCNARAIIVGEECASRSSGCDPKTSEGNKTSTESGNGSLPTEMKRLMVNKALGETLLHRAARSNRKDVVHYCLESNTCDINARDNAGFTPLHECCTRGHLEIAKIFLENGADVNANAGGIRPLHDAIENNHIEVARLLLAYGADPNISTYSGLTPLKLARSKAMIRFLKGFLHDITGEIQNQNQPSDSENKPVLPWKCTGSSSFMDPSQSGFNVFDGAPSDGDGEELDDFLFEVSDTPLDPTFRIHLPSTKSYNFLRLSDVLKRTGLTKEDFIKKHSNIEMISIPRNQFESATISQLLTPSRHQHQVPLDCYVDVIRLDDNIRNILGIETVRLR